MKSQCLKRIYLQRLKPSQLLRMIIKGYKKETKTRETLTQAKSMTEPQSPQRSGDFIPGTSGCALSWCTQAVHNCPLPLPSLHLLSDFIQT